MLIVRKSGKRALDIFFDVDGAKLIMAALAQLGAKPMENALVAASFGDPSDVSTQHSGQLELSLCDNRRIELHRSRIKIWIDESLVQLAEDMLEEFLEIGYFLPAEYTSLPTGKRENIDIYFHSISLL